MRTTITIDDDLLAEAKVRAARAGTTLSAIVEEALRTTLSRQNARAEAPPLPTFAGSRLLPGVDLDDSAALLEHMEAAEH